MLFALEKAKPVVAATGFEVGDLFPLILRPMRNKPNGGNDYVVIVVRLPVKLLLRLGRWLTVAAGAYALLHQ